MQTNVALVTTLRGAVSVLDSFLRHHIGLGFSHIYLFFDDGQDEGIELARKYESNKVVVTVRGYNLEREWRQCLQYGVFAPYVDLEVMSRQALNVEIAAKWALEAGDEWLLHIDSDELFYCPNYKNVGAHFRHLSACGIERAIYPNVEAVTETMDVADYFKEVTLFKANPITLPEAKLSSEQIAMISRLRMFPENFFLLYRNGKSAARLVPGLLPDGPHRFRSTTAISDDSQSNVSLREQVINDCRILHYPCCGYANFLKKYRLLGNFADVWFGCIEIRKSVGDFHLLARDTVATNDDTRCRTFYREHVMIDNQAAISALKGAGLLQRINRPANWLNRRPS